MSMIESLERSGEALSPAVRAALIALEARVHQEGDYFASHDIEDIVTVVAGRAELVDEIAAEPADGRD